MALLLRDGYTSQTTDYTFEISDSQFGFDTLTYQKFFGLGGGENAPATTSFQLGGPVYIDIPFKGPTEIFDARIFGDIAATFGLNIEAALNTGGPGVEGPGSISATLPYELAFAYPNLDSDDKGKIIDLLFLENFEDSEGAGFETLFPSLTFSMDLVAELDVLLKALVEVFGAGPEFTVLDFDVSTVVPLIDIDTARVDEEGVKDPVNVLGVTTPEMLDYLDGIVTVTEDFNGDVTGVKLPFAQFLSSDTAKDKPKADVDTKRGDTKADEQEDPPDPAGLDVGSLEIFIPNINTVSTFADGIYVTDPSRRLVDGEAVEVENDNNSLNQGNRAELAALTVDLDGLLTYATGFAFPPLEYNFPTIGGPFGPASFSADFSYNLFDVELRAGLPLEQEFTLTPALSTKLRFYELNEDGTGPALDAQGAKIAKSQEVVQIAKALTFVESGSLKSEALETRLREIAEESLIAARDIALFVDFDAGVPAAFTGQTASIGGRLVMRTEPDAEWQPLFSGSILAESAPALGQDQTAELDLSNIELAYQIFRDDTAANDDEFIPISFEEAAEALRFEDVERIRSITETPYLDDLDVLNLRYEEGVFVEVEHRANPIVTNRTGLEFDLSLLLEGIAASASFNVAVDFGLFEIAAGLDLDIGPLYSERFALLNAELVDLFNDSFTIEGSQFSDFVLGAPAPDQDYGDAIVGTDGPDTRPGTDSSDVIAGLDGNDTIHAGDGDDTVFGGEGLDSLIGGAGYDTADFGDLSFVSNNGSYDLFETGARIGVRMAAGNFDNQTSIGFDPEEVDVILHEATGQRDTIEEIERVRFTDFSDRLTYSTRTPETTYSGPNLFEFLGGDDYLSVQVTHDDPPEPEVTFLMGDGDDTVVFSSLDVDGADHLSGFLVDGGDGVDTLEVTGDFDLNTGAGPDGALLINFENVTATGDGAGLTGDGADNFLIGSLGDDTIRGGEGDDTLYANIRSSGSDVSADDVDVLIGGAGADELRGYAGGTRTTADYSGADSSVYIKYFGISGRGYRGEAQGDVLWHITNIKGSDYDDILISGTTDQVLEGGAGNDRLKAGSRGDQLFGGDGDDLLVQEDADRATDNRFYDGGEGFDIVAVEVVDPYTLTGDAFGSARFVYETGSFLAGYTTTSERVTMDIEYDYTVDEHVEVTLDDTGGGRIEYVQTVDPNSIMVTNVSGLAIFGWRRPPNFPDLSPPTVEVYTTYDIDINPQSLADLVGDTIAFPRRDTGISNGTGTIENRFRGFDHEDFVYDRETFANIEGVIGSQGDDKLTGNDHDNALFGNGGNDVIQGGGGNDRLGFGDVQLIEDVLSFPGSDEWQTAGYYSSVPAPAVTTLADQLAGLNPDGPLEGDQTAPVGRIKSSGEEVGAFLWGQAGSDTLDMRYDRGISFFPDRSDNYAVVDLNVAASDAPINAYTNERVEYGRAQWFDASGTELSMATTFGIENVIGSQNSDTIRGDDNDNVIQGLGDADIMYGEGGFDTLSYDLATSGVGLLFNIFAGSAGAHVASSANGAAHPLASGFNGQFGDAEGDRGLGFERFVTTAYDDYILFATYPVTEERRFDIDGSTLVAYYADRDHGDDVSFFETGAGDDTFVASGAYAANVDFGDGNDLLEIWSGGGVTADMGAGDDTVTVSRSATALLGQGFFPISYSDASDQAALLNVLDGGDGLDKITFDGPLDQLSFEDGKIVVERTEDVITAAKIVDGGYVVDGLTDAELNALADQPTAPLRYELSNFEILEVDGQVIRLDSQDPILGADLALTLDEDAVDPFDLNIRVPADEQGLMFRVLFVPAEADIAAAGADPVVQGDILSAADLEALQVRPLQGYGLGPDAIVFEPILSAEQIEEYKLLNDALPEPRVVNLPPEPPLPGIALNLQEPVDPLGGDVTVTITEVPSIGEIVLMKPEPLMEGSSLMVIAQHPLGVGDVITAAEVAELRFVPTKDAFGDAGTFKFEVATGTGFNASVAETVELDAEILAALDGTAKQSVSLSILPVDDAPEIARLLFPISPAGELRAILSASDIEGDAFSTELVDAPRFGSINVLADGSFEYLQTGVIDFDGEDFIDDFFTVRAVQDEDGLASAARTQTIRIFAPEALAPIVFDESQDDVFFDENGAPVALGGFGTNDMIIGHSGKDKLFGFGGNDKLMGGDDDDELDGGDGDDTLEGGMGANRHVLGRGDDKVMGTAAELNEDSIADFEDGDSIFIADYAPTPGAVSVSEGSAVFHIDTTGEGTPDSEFRLEGDFAGRLFEMRSENGGSVIELAGPGSSQLTPGAERFVTTDPGVNRVYGDAGDDVILTANGDDILSGGAGSDLLLASGGDDTLIGGAGGDRMTGGTGRDTFVIAAADFVSGGFEADFLTDFTPGEDRLELTGFDGLDLLDLPLLDLPSGMGLNLGESRFVVFEGLTQEEVQTAEIAVTDAAQSFVLLSTRTVHDLTEEDDRFITEVASSVHVRAGAGDDAVIGSQAGDVLEGEDGADVLIGSGGADRLIGGTGSDRLSGGSDADVFEFALADKTGSFSVDFVVDFEIGLDRVALSGFDESIFDPSIVQQDSASVAVSVAEGYLIVFEGGLIGGELLSRSDVFEFI